MIALVLLVSTFLFLIGYFFYGKKIKSVFELNDKNLTPAHTQKDGVDYLPTSTPILFGHHFSSIAGAGPVVGPIVAALAFGWLPVLCWIVVGAIFIGGVHDAGSLIASVRHKAKSIAQVARENMSRRAYILFLVFIWLALVYVITVFLDLTAATFSMDGSVASSSMLFILIALVFGFSYYRLKFPFYLCTLLALLLLFASLWLGIKYPIPSSSLPAFLGDSKKTWDIILLLYCFAASITPVWILLQPRDYLSSYCLYISLFGAFFGIIFGGFSLKFPAYIGFKPTAEQVLYPLLFINVACGACSGFHSVVSSGTTSKQLDKESDVIKIGYGAMLIEGVVAVIALSTIMTLGKENPLCVKSPLMIYSAGMGKFFHVLGLDIKVGTSFAMLALSTFLLTTLDTATRLGRYILEEICQVWNRSINRYFSTLATVFFPAIFVLITIKNAQGKPIPAWKAIWPVFGATNQLLAGLALLTITVWMGKMKKGKNVLITLIPMVFMLFTSMWALILIMGNYGVSLIGGIAFALFLLGCLFSLESVQILKEIL